MTFGANLVRNTSVTVDFLETLVVVRHKSVTQKGVTQETFKTQCPTRVSRKHVMEERSTKVSCKSATVCDIHIGLHSGSWASFRWFSNLFKIRQVFNSELPRLSCIATSLNCRILAPNCAAPSFCMCCLVPSRRGHHLSSFPACKKSQSLPASWLRFRRSKRLLPGD